MAPTIKKLYYSISEVSEITELKAYVLRYWETEFGQLNPPKNRAGNRTYRQKDIEIILKIKDLLYDKKYTIDGARNILKEKISIDSVNGNSTRNIDKDQIILSKIKDELKSILSIISK
ncbi:MAG: transcriptional regulator [Candidatus Marinimicrobia bacterium]|nr:transcriptional regulator [Candidatus Neomarinimicrobiota bacterium]